MPELVKRRGGRPRSENPRSDQVMVRLTPEEKATLEALAGPGGIAEYLRSVGLGQRPRIRRQVPAVNTAAWRELSRTLSNLNQIAAGLNAGQVHVVGDDLRDLLRQVTEQVVALRASLLGEDE
jgi:hypothetical protein